MPTNILKIKILLLKYGQTDTVGIKTNTAERHPRTHIQFIKQKLNRDIVYARMCGKATLQNMGNHSRHTHTHTRHSQLKYPNDEHNSTEHSKFTFFAWIGLAWFGLAFVFFYCFRFLVVFGICFF